MYRVASRALALLALVAVLGGGMVFFAVEYALEAEDWVMEAGSPHVYEGTKVRLGVLTDREGKLLLDSEGDRSYSNLSQLRSATVHWVGDRQGNIPSILTKTYADQLTDYSLSGGTYHYADARAQMHLTLDGDVQMTALEAMGGYKGTVAVYNYQTGQLLCALSTPTFDPDDLPDISGDTTGAYEGAYVNRFLKSVYIPGSIFKVVTLAAALECVPDALELRFTCTGTFETSGGKITCERPHGEQSLQDAFCNSCNCAFAQLTHTVGRENMSACVQRFGLQEVVRFDGFSTTPGNYDLTDASLQQFAWSGIGQYTDQVNPCSYLRFIGAIANGGQITEPYVVERITIADDTTYTSKVTHGQQILSPETAAVLQQFMGYNVTAKYGAEHFGGLTVCAKSGTGEVGGGKRPNAMFTGFVADEDLPLAFIVCIEEGGYGAQTCIPVLAPVLEACAQALRSP